jgi:class 3 adenylate cyclase
LPKLIAQRLKQNPGIIADSFESVTVMFADIVGFTNLSAQISALELVQLLNEIFSLFDALAQGHNLEKIKTIGDAYMVVGGLSIANENHLSAIADLALDMQQEIAQVQTLQGKIFQIRIGINCGSVVAGVIGSNKFIYDLWGDTVNVASRMESTGIPGYIQVTESIYEQLKEFYEFEPRGLTQIKGKGEMMTYWLKAKKM